MTTPAKNDDLHGMVPDECPVALLIIDMINDFDFEGGDQLLENAVPMAERLAALKRQARMLGIPVIYVNDNFGRWRSDFKTAVTRCVEDGMRGRAVVGALQPDDEDYFVLKPKHSGFYATSLDILLQYLKARTLIIPGLAGDSCVLFTAHDAFLRDYHLIIPADCTASIDAGANERVIDQMRSILKADTRVSTEIDLAGLINES